jgi:hypothetical protein
VVCVGLRRGTDLDCEDLLEFQMCPKNARLKPHKPERRSSPIEKPANL